MINPLKLKEMLSNASQAQEEIQAKLNQLVVEGSAVFGGKSVNVLLGEDKVGVVERLQVAQKGALGELVVQLVAAVMELLQHPANGTGDLAGLDVGADSRRRGGKDGERREEEDAVQGAVEQHRAGRTRRAGAQSHLRQEDRRETGRDPG